MGSEDKPEGVHGWIKFAVFILCTAIAAVLRPVFHLPSWGGLVSLAGGIALTALFWWVVYPAVQQWRQRHGG